VRFFLLQALARQPPLVFNLTSMLSPTFVATTRASWTRHDFAIDLYGFQYDPTNLGYPASLVSQAQSVSFPGTQIGGYTDIGPTRAAATSGISATPGPSARR
jgi:hypothetical protein